MTHTAETLAALSLKQLAEIYNQHAATPIKAFSKSKADAVARVLSVLPKPVATVSKPKVGSGAYIRERLLARDFTKYAEIVADLLAKFPTSRATVKDVAWHACQLRQAGEL